MVEASAKSSSIFGFKSSTRKYTVLHLFEVFSFALLLKETSKLLLFIYEQNFLLVLQKERKKIVCVVEVLRIF